MVHWEENGYSDEEIMYHRCLESKATDDSKKVLQNKFDSLFHNIKHSRKNQKNWDPNTAVGKQ